MEDNELNSKVLRNVRSKIVVSNLEREENMKINVKKQMLSICAVALVMISGGFFTVNAATNGQLAQNIKDFVTVTFTKTDGTTENVEGKVVTDEYGNSYLEYEEKGEDWEAILHIDKTEVEKEKLELDVNFTESKDEDGKTVESNIEFKARN